MSSGSSLVLHRRNTGAISSTISSYSVSSLQHFSCAFPNDNAGGHSVAGRYPRHNGTVCNTQVIDSIYLKLAVYDRHGVPSHLCGTRLMPTCDNRISNKVFQRFSLHLPWYHLASYERPQCSGVSYLATEFHAPDHGLQIVRVS